MKAMIASIILAACISIAQPCEICGAVGWDNSLTEYHICGEGDDYGVLCQKCREDVWLPSDIQELGHVCPQ